MKRVVVLVAIGAALVLGALFLWRPGPADLAAPPSVAGLVSGAVTRWVAISDRQVAVIESLTAANRRLYAERQKLDARLAASERYAAGAQDSIRRLLEAPAPDTGAVLERVAALVAVGNACRASLGNCEARARNDSAAVAAAEGAMRETQRKALIVVGTSIAVLVTLLLAK